ncbi:serine/threonine protein kinase [Capronia epimyces CBS 606.96]|uniref:Serine/threonine protein kinase n=1 Tax=Capronia epimyces CBS 606.96 TaxID=1182542 RepID=W9YAU7_9EURO|nr:serine/threonine protein kinase [Capronia epimyces CBS 606.96]EXJ86351.1 serine/threonine protein kinase [Capronia epimyces CBS 606.96]
MESIPFAEFVHLDGTTVTDKIIGIGGTNIVVQQGKYAVKVPRLSRITEIGGTTVLLDQSKPPKEGDYDYRAQLIRALKNEKDIYRRIGPHVGITPCYNISSTQPSVQMPLMGKDLQHYLAENRPSRKEQLAWMRRLADTLAYIHSRRVIAADIGPSNIVLDSALNVKFIDFSESTLMPLDWNLEGTDSLGYSILSDIGQLGAVMFQIVTGQTGRFDTEDASGEVTWPPRDSLPSTDNVWLGPVIEKCWTQGFKSAGDLAGYLKQVNDDE